MIEERLNRLERNLDGALRRRPWLLVMAVCVATVLVTLVLAMGTPPAVVYQAF